MKTYLRNPAVQLAALVIAVGSMLLLGYDMAAAGVGGAMAVGMIIDAELQLSDAQALTATAASTNLIDLGVDRDIGKGEPLALVITVDVALAGTSPTFQPAIQTDDNAAFSSATTLLTGQSYSALAAGAKIVLPIPDTNERYLRANYTLGGTSPTITVTAVVQPMSTIQNDAIYADGFAIT